MNAFRLINAAVLLFAAAVGVLAQVIEAPSSVVPDGEGGLYVVSPRLNRIFRISADGGQSVVAGSQRYYFSGDGGPATRALLASPESVAVDPVGNLFIADTWNHRIRKIDSEGIITTVAGSGEAGDGGDGGPATAAELFNPESVAVDPAGNLVIGESGNHRIRKIDSEGIIATIAGNGTGGSSGDGGPATAAQISFPQGLAVDAAGNVYFGESGRIRRVGPDGIITTVAGNGEPGFSGDGGPATAAQISTPRSVAVDALGNLFIADTRNHRIRRVDRDGVITTVAGSGACCLAGDGGTATAAELNFPQGVGVDRDGNLFIADLSNRVRKVDPNGIITTLVGN